MSRYTGPGPLDLVSGKKRNSKGCLEKEREKTVLIHWTTGPGPLDRDHRTGSTGPD